MKKLAEGTLQTTFYHIIPFLIFISSSRITNGKNVETADKEIATGKVLSLHITPFISIGIVIPRFLLPKK